MRAILNRSVRPRIGSSGGVRLPSTTPPNRQAIFPPSRRKLTFNDAFTILLAPVFAAAFVADITSKDRKRCEWDKKIADVKKEIETLQEKELQAWSVIQSRSIQSGACYQRRQYSTAARALQAEDDVDELGFSQDLIESATQSIRPIQSRDHQKDECITDRSAPKVVLTLTEWHQYERLVASKLAIEMLMHLRTGRSNLLRQPMEMCLDSQSYSSSLDELAIQLRRINLSLQQMSKRKPRHAVPKILLDGSERLALHETIKRLTEAYRKQTINAADLVFGYANAIAQSSTAPMSDSYRYLSENFAAQNQDSLAYCSAAALQNSMQILSNRNLQSMISHYGKYQDTGRFSAFIWLLTKRDSILKLVTPWHQVIVNGVRVAAPVDSNSDLLLCLVKAALQCHMPHKAEAWATLLFQKGQTKRFAYVFRSIIDAYTEECDWTNGSRWMQEVMKWSACIGQEMPSALPRTISRVLGLCVACDQAGKYEEILEAAVSAGIQPEVIDNNRPLSMSERSWQLREDWRARLQSRAGKLKEIEHLTLAERATFFQQILAKNEPYLNPYVGLLEGPQIVAIDKQRQEAKATTGDGKGKEKDAASQKFLPLANPLKMLDNRDTKIAMLEREREHNLLQIKEALKQISDLRFEKGVKRRQIKTFQEQLTEYAHENEGLRNQIETQKQELQQLHKNSTSPDQTNPQESATKIEVAAAAAVVKEGDPSQLYLLTDHQQLRKDFDDLQGAYDALCQEHRELLQVVGRRQHRPTNRSDRFGEVKSLPMSTAPWPRRVTKREIPGWLQQRFNNESHDPDRI